MYEKRILLFSYAHAIALCKCVRVRQKGREKIESESEGIEGWREEDWVREGKRKKENNSVKWRKR